LALSFAADPYSENSDDRLPTKETVDFEKEQGKVGDLFSMRPISNHASSTGMTGLFCVKLLQSQ